MKLRARARKLLGRELSEHTVCCSTRVDHAVFSDLRRRSSKVDEMLTTPPALPEGDSVDSRIWERMGEDMWTALYSDDEPTIKARDKIDPKCRVNREVASKHIREDGFADTRSMTRGQLTESALGWLGAMGHLKGAYGDELAEHAQTANEIQQQQDNIESIDDKLEALREQRNELGGDPVEIDQQIRVLAVDKQGAIDRMKAAEKQQARVAGDLVDAAKRVAAGAQQAAEEAVECASLLPGKEAGQRQRVSPDTMIAFAERVKGNNTLRKVLEMMGRLDLSMGTVRRQFRKGGFEEVVDVELGNDLPLVLPFERGLLAHPIGKYEFARRFHEESLRQFEIWSEQELKRGPIILGADGSDSMRGIANEFCRGLTLACCSIGNREGRNTAALEFGSAGQLREFWFPGDKPLDPATALDFATSFFGGGTDINQVMERAAEMINTESPFHSADLVLITDGGDTVTERTIELRDQLRAMGVKIHGIAVGIKPTPYLLTVCDRTSAIFDFAGPNPTSDRLAIDIS